MKINYYLLLLPLMLFVAACEKLEQEPESTTSKSAVFGSDNGLQLYANSFYGILPGTSTSLDAMSDYLAVKAVPTFIQENAFAPSLSSGWSWGDLRNINYFIENNTGPGVSAESRRHYMGLAKFFRAYFYFEKVKRFGDVPWIGKPLDVNDPALYNGRDSRTLVMDSVLADIDYACANLRATADNSRSTVTRDIAFALKSRICLFEGTFRKYHTQLNLQSTANAWLTNAAAASKVVMDKGTYTINSTGGPGASYRLVFTNPAPVANEVMMAAVTDITLNVLNDANWWWTSGTYGAKASLIRTFVNTYLNRDGTPFTNNPAYPTMVFKDEVKNRDLRLQQTIRMGSYKRVNGGVQVAAPPVFTYTFTGYHPIKFSLDDMYYDAGALNNNSIPLFRFAEVLLNYAEAKAELGTLTDAEWASTVGVLRARGGITGGLTTKPTIADPYLMTNYFPGISDATILEVRRERGIELSLEGHRFPDLLRWKRGPLMQMEWNGFYVPALNTPMDLNEDGVMDVLFYSGTKPANIAGVTFVDVSPTIGTAVNSQRLKNGTSGELTWMNEISRKWNDKQYFYPIPQVDVLKNPKLGQNPGW
ncbi:RagB/SusD family nutrient uptake outer membrane protein [Daejeonella lutea]|uniref:Starch-binding associating with outer membrane n=1 Tax=Daejeonella lutea TaxID=572036 RepID=A0A1T5EWP8_9SPHI|nr:RagB/SusD family nutrient uptake outer membrane protein [Daejeonella lutea]SKB88394.1 Starch-binding associating with outer membrane [Daejeonella lutea]